jgi:hypothetical protein
MSLTKDDRADPAPQVFARDFDGELVLLDLAAGEYYGLDELGARLWNGLVEGRTAYEIAQLVRKDYDVDFERLVGDLTRLAGDLEGKGLVMKRAEDAPSNP